MGAWPTCSGACVRWLHCMGVRNVRHMQSSRFRGRLCRQCDARRLHLSTHLVRGFEELQNCCTGAEGALSFRPELLHIEPTMKHYLRYWKRDVDVTRCMGAPLQAAGRRACVE